MAKFIYLITESRRWSQAVKGGEGINSNLGRFCYSYQVPNILARSASPIMLIQLDTAVAGPSVTRVLDDCGDAIPMVKGTIHRAAVTNFAEVTKAAGIAHLPEFYRKSIRQEVTRLHIYRAGRTNWHRAGRLIGRADSPLLESSEIQADRVARLLNRFDIAAAVSSTSGRAIDSRNLLVRKQSNVHCFSSPGLAEMHYGDIEGLTLDEAKRLNPISMFQYANRPDVFRAPGGESFSEVQKRSVSAVQKIVRDFHGQHVLLVTHKTVLAALACHYTNRSLKHAWQVCQHDHFDHITVAFKGQHAWIEQGLSETTESRHLGNFFDNMPNRGAAWA